jgi:hypothetical protein
MQISEIIPNVAELQDALTRSFKEGREKIIKSAEESLANQIMFRLFAAAQQCKRSVDIDWQSMLEDYPTVFQRKAIRSVHEVLLQKGYLVYAEGMKGVAWRLRSSKHASSMTIIVPGQVEIEEPENKE